MLESPHCCTTYPLHRLLASLLCLSLALEPALGVAAPVKREAPASVGTVKQIQGEERVLHALNRLTFGPRPGEVAAVQGMGLTQWFERQLRPETIDDSALDARLSRFPAMSLSQDQLFQEFPSPQMIRQMIASNAPLPSDPLQHAFYADHIAFYKAAKDRKEAAKAQGTTASGTAALGMAASMADSSVTPEEVGARRPNLLNGTSSVSRISASKAAPEPAEAANIAGGQADDLPKQESDTKGRQRHAEGIFPEAETQAVLRLSPDLRVQRLLTMEPEDLVRLRKSLSKAELTALLEGLSPRQVEILASLQGSARMVGAEVLQSRLERDVYSERELQAVMTDFWLNHFSVYLRKNQNEPYLLPAYERETIRPHALGKFEDLLLATARSPAMLVYLDNWQSVGPESTAALRSGLGGRFPRKLEAEQALKQRGLNENYARELMELHTVGVGCEVSKDRAVAMLDPACGTGYTQADVTEVAKVFSGWTIEGPNRGGLYRFDERRHEPGTKTVMGHRIGQAGEDEGREVLHLLATSPATARFISSKLAVRFVSDDPPPSLVGRMAGAFLASGGDISVVLRTMVQSPEFWSPTTIRAKVKTPLEFVASALRASDADIRSAVPLVQALERLGMPLYGMQTPNGYSWTAEPWVSTGALVTRMNFALVLSSGRIEGTQVSIGLARGSIPKTLTPVSLPKAARTESNPTEMEERRLESLLLGRPAGERTRAAVLAQAKDAAGAATASASAERDLSLFPAEGDVVAVPVLDSCAGAHEREQGDSRAAIMAGLLLGSPEFQRR